jgi:phosphopantothenoylcysteine decarboxylase/phosphopantothenate--cysteine ligase
VLITAGPTREPIDPVRFLSNYSTGYMGARLAAEARRRGHRVTVIAGPISERLPQGVRVVPIDSSRDLERALHREAPRADAVIMAAAVADFRPAHPARSKRPRRGRVTLRLQATPDLIAGLPRRARQIRVGFALETGRVLQHARQKLLEKRLDLLLAQRMNGTGSPFGRRDVHAWLLQAGTSAARIRARSKAAVARLLLDKVEALWYGQRRATAFPRRG